MREHARVVNVNVHDEVRLTYEAAKNALGQDIELIQDLSFSSRAWVVRVACPDGRTLIAKRHARNEWHRSEVMALSLLPEKVRPALILSNDDVVVMEDLGDGSSLADLLLGDDAHAAEDALLGWSHTIGTIAATTLGKADVDDKVMKRSFDFDAFEHLARSWNLPTPLPLREELENASYQLGVPLDAMSLVAFDACPDNNRVIDGMVRLFDFEGAAWAHPAFDASYCLAPFCTCWCLAHLPDGMRDKMFHTYASQLPVEIEDLRLRSVQAGALLILGGMRRSTDLMDDNPVLPPTDRGPLQARQHLLLRCEWIQEQAEYLPVTARFAGAIVGALRDRFPDTTVPLYPAFRNGLESP